MFSKVALINISIVVSRAAFVGNNFRSLHNLNFKNNAKCNAFLIEIFPTLL